MAGYIRESLGAGYAVMGAVCDNALKMSELIDVPLEFSRLGRKELVRSTVDMTVLAREVAKEAVAHAPGRRIETKAGDLPPAVGDLALLRQVMVNLISNVVKYTGGRDVAHLEVGGAAGPDFNT